MAMERKLTDWEGMARKARGMTVESLLFAIKDCGECVRLDINAGYYADEASVYNQELLKRRAC